MGFSSVVEGSDGINNSNRLQWAFGLNLLTYRSYGDRITKSEPIECDRLYNSRRDDRYGLRGNARENYGYDESNANFALYDSKEPETGINPSFNHNLNPPKQPISGYGSNSAVEEFPEIPRMANSSRYSFGSNVRTGQFPEQQPILSGPFSDSASSSLYRPNEDILSTTTWQLPVERSLNHQSSTAGFSRSVMYPQNSMLPPDPPGLSTAGHYPYPAQCPTRFNSMPMSGDYPNYPPSSIYGQNNRFMDCGETHFNANNPLRSYPHSHSSMSYQHSRPYAPSISSSMHSMYSMSSTNSFINVNRNNDFIPRQHDQYSLGISKSTNRSNASSSVNRFNVERENDIVLEKVKSGEDKRTTLMIRNIPNR